jgi:hypothetical protein
MAQQLALERTDAPAAVTPMQLIERASAAGASIETLQQLFELKLRVEADEARKAFNAAMADFKAHPPRINKNKHVKFGSTEYDHATLDNVTDSITAALSKVGISHKWAIEQKDGKIIVTCVLTHNLGHSERTPIEAAADTSGSKNAIQAIGSAVTYLQRYTLLSATGLAVAGADNDGQTAGGSEMNEQSYVSHLDNIQNAHTQEELKRVFAAAYKEANEAGDTSARDAFVKAKDNKKLELAR